MQPNASVNTPNEGGTETISKAIKLLQDAANEKAEQKEIKKLANNQLEEARIAEELVKKETAAIKIQAAFREHQVLTPQQNEFLVNGSVWWYLSF